MAIINEPVWIDLNAGDTAAEQAFYRSVFGWEWPEQHSDAGGWRPAVVGDAMAGGMSPRPEGMPFSAWTVFFGTDDIEAAITAASELGAAAVMPALPVVIDGTLMTTIALMVDPAGAIFGLAQQGANPGMTHRGEGSALWFELSAADLESAREFYSALLDVTVHPVPQVAPLDYATLNGPAGAFAGTMPVMGPEGTPSAWSIYFYTDDVDAAIGRATAAGGSVLMGPETMHAGRIAFLSDPEGAVFGLLHPTPM